MKLQLITAGLMIVAATTFTGAAGSFSQSSTTVVNKGDTTGIFNGNVNHTEVGLYTTPNYAALTFYRNTYESTNADFSIGCDQNGSFFQVIDEKGKVHHIPVSALLKLESK